MLDVYQKNKDNGVFETHSSATVFGVYLFTSKTMLEKDKGAWIATLTKLPKESEPDVSYKNLKIKALRGLNDTVKSEDEIALAKLNKYLKKRNLELCSFNQRLQDMELECIHKADAKHPNYDYPEHTDYVDKLEKEEREKLAKKYNLADSIFSRIGVFGMGYCK